MSLNKIVNSPQLNLECKDLSFGVGQLKTKIYEPILQISGGQVGGTGNTITNSSNFLYQCDDISLRIKGWINYTSSVTPQNNLYVVITLPDELKSRFSSGVVYSTGVVSEYPFNTNTNFGSVVYGEFNNDLNIENTIFYNKGNQGTTQIGFRVNLDVVIYSQII